MRLVSASLGLVLGLLAAPAFADEASPPDQTTSSVYRTLEQIPLTADEVQHYIDSMADMQAVMGDAPADAAEPDPATMAKLGAIANNHGFKDFDDYNTVAGNIALVLDGVDPQSKTYVGAEAMIRKSIDEVTADKQMKEADKKAALADLQTQLKMAPPVKYKGNIDVVLKNYDKLTAQ
jgi:hypothetical protein